jgi:hypothetical protein
MGDHQWVLVSAEIVKKGVIFSWTGGQMCDQDTGSQQGKNHE